MALLSFAAAAVTLFEPIYLYILGYSLQAIIFFYFITYVLYTVLLPLGGKYAARHGFARSMLVGSLLLIFYYLALFGVQQFWWLYFLAPVILAIHKTFYWIGYHGDFAQSVTTGEVGRDIGEANLVTTLVNVVGPIAGGALAARFGFSYLFVFVALLILLSNLPLLRMAKSVVPVTFSYHAAFARLTAQKNRRRFVAYLGYGDELLFYVPWPIFLFTVMGGVLGVGAILTLSVLVTAAALLYIGRLTDFHNRQGILRWGIAGLVLSWIIKPFAATGVHLFFADAFYRISGGATQYPILTERYESARAADILESVTFFEMSLSIGKVLTMAALFVILFLFRETSWVAIFFLGALCSLFYGFLPLPSRQAA